MYYGSMRVFVCSFRDACTVKRLLVFPMFDPCEPTTTNSVYVPQQQAVERQILTNRSWMSRSRSESIWILAYRSDSCAPLIHTLPLHTMKTMMNINMAMAYG